MVLAALVMCAAVAPVLPPLAWKVKVTLIAAVLAAAGLLFRAQRENTAHSEGTAGLSGLEMPAFAFLAAALLATAFSVEPIVSFFPSRFRGEGLMVYIGYVTLALAAARLSRRDAHRVITAMLAGGMVVALIALPQYYGVDILRALGFRSMPLSFFGADPVQLRLDSIWIGLRAQGTLGNPIFLGALATLLLPLAVVLMLHARGRAVWAYGGAAVMLYAALVTSQTRSAWIGAAAGGLILVWLMPKTAASWRRAALLVVGFVVVTAVLVLTHPHALLTQRLSSAVDTKDYSLHQKLYVWKHTLPLIAQRPVQGWGFSTLVGQFKDIGSPEYLQVFGSKEIVLVDSPHNELLHIAYSAGLLGLAAYAWLWAAAVGGIRRALRDRPEVPCDASSTSTIAAGLAAALTGYGVWMQFGWSMIGPANVLWVVLGLAVAAGAAHPDSGGPPTA